MGLVYRIRPGRHSHLKDERVVQHYLDSSPDILHMVSAGVLA